MECSKRSGHEVKSDKTTKPIQTKKQTKMIGVVSVGYERRR